MGLVLQQVQVIWVLINLGIIAFVLADIPGSSSGLILQPPAVSPSTNTTSIDQASKGRKPTLSSRQSTAQSPEQGLAPSVPTQAPHDLAPLQSAKPPDFTVFKPPHDSAPSQSAKPPDFPVVKPPHDAAPPHGAETPLGQPHNSMPQPVAESPHSAAAPPVAELPKSAFPPLLVEPPNASAVPLAPELPKAVAPVSSTKPPEALIMAPTAEKKSISPTLQPPENPQHVLSPPSQLGPSRMSSPTTAPSTVSIAPSLTLPLPLEPPSSSSPPPVDEPPLFEPPPPAVAHPPLLLSPPLVVRPSHALPKIPAAEPPHASSLKPPDASAQLPAAQSPYISTPTPPESQPVFPAMPPFSSLKSPPIPPNASSLIPQPPLPVALPPLQSGMPVTSSSPPQLLPPIALSASPQLPLLNSSSTAPQSTPLTVSFPPPPINAQIAPPLPVSPPDTSFPPPMMAPPPMNPPLVSPSLSPPVPSDASSPPPQLEPSHSPPSPPQLFLPPASPPSYVVPLSSRPSMVPPPSYLSPVFPSPSFNTPPPNSGKPPPMPSHVLSPLPQLVPPYLHPPPVAEPPHVFPTPPPIKLRHVSPPNRVTKPPEALNMVPAADKLPILHTLQPPESPQHVLSPSSQLGSSRASSPNTDPSTVSFAPPLTLPLPLEPPSSSSPLPLDEPPQFEPPPPAVANPPLLLSPPLVVPPSHALPEVPAAQPRHASPLPLAAKPPDSSAQLPAAQSPHISTLTPPESHRVFPAVPPFSSLKSPPMPPNASSLIPQPPLPLALPPFQPEIPVTSSPPPQLLPPVAPSTSPQLPLLNSSSPPPQLVPVIVSFPPPPINTRIAPPIPVSPDISFPSPTMAPPPMNPPPVSPSLSPPVPPDASSPPPQLEPSYSPPSPPQLLPPPASPSSYIVPLSPPPSIVSPPMYPLPVLPSPSFDTPPPSSAASPPMPSHALAPLPQVVPPYSHPPPVAEPPQVFPAPPPIELPHVSPPSPSIVPGAFPPHAWSPPHSLTPPLAPTVPAISSHALVSPPMMVPPHALFAPPPTEVPASFTPPTVNKTMQAAPSLPSRSKGTHRAPPPLLTSPDLSPPPSEVSPRASPPVSQVKQGSSPPTSQQINSPMHAPFPRSNTSDPHAPPLPAPAPRDNPVSDAAQPVTPPHSVPDQLSPTTNSPHPGPGFHTRNGTAPAPFAFQVHAPSAGVHHYLSHSPKKGSPIVMAPSPSSQEIPEIPPAPSPISRAPHAHSEKNSKKPLAPQIRSLPPPPPNTDCAYQTCTEPLTNKPPGSPCGCVWPMQAGLRINVALFTFFPLAIELAREIAAGVFLNQSQVRVMGASAATEDPERCIVLVDMLPLDDNFDNVTSFFIFQRFWHKQVDIDKSIFGDYEVLYVRYPGLPPSPPLSPADVAVINGMPYSVGDPNGSKLHPLGVDVTKQRHKQRLNAALIVVVVVSVVVGLLICCSVFWVLVFRHANNKSEPIQSPRALHSLPTSTGPTGLSAESGQSSPSSFGSSLATYTGSAKTFSASEMEKATDNFNSSRILGEGGFGLVYRGVLEDQTEVAVKVLKREDQQGGREFLAEVEMLSRLHHRNLVRLIGICTDARLRCLVYELIPNGSVESHLHDGETSPLDWASRLKIALGAARGLAYLHEDSSPRVIHRDFKASNILLEYDFTAKVSDFGLARSAMDEENKHISTRVMGTFGYVAPEYAMTGHLLVKSDVYSYGVVLLELLTGRKPVDMSQPAGQENLVAWTRPLLTSREGLESIVDSSLVSDVPIESVAKVAAIASMCVQSEVSHRPFMGEVVQALKLVCNECDDSKDGDSRNRSQENLSMPFDATVSPPLGTPDPLEGQLSLHGYAPGHDLEKGLSVSEIFSASATLGSQTSGSFRRQSASGPLRTARSRQFWQRMRRLSHGSVSEHGIMYK